MANLWAVSLSRLFTSSVHNMLRGTLQRKTCGIPISHRCSLQAKIQPYRKTRRPSRLSRCWYRQETSGIRSSLLSQNDHNTILHYHIKPSTSPQQDLKQLDSHAGGESKSDKNKTASQRRVYECQPEKANDFTQIRTQESS